MKRSPENPQPDQKSKASDGFINRWAQRKREANATPAAEVTDLDAELPDAVVPELELGATDPNTLTNATVEQEGSDTQELTDADMPDIATLNGESDFSPFFSEGVSKELRNLALKKLFFSGKFSARDGLDDYDDDFTHFEPLGDTVTSDMKFHRRRKEKARLAELEAQAAEDEKQGLAAEEEPVLEHQQEQLDGSQAELEESPDSAPEKTEEQQTDELPESSDIHYTDANRDNEEVEVAIGEEAQHPLG